MKKIFLKQYNALFDYPIVEEPKKKDYYSMGIDGEWTFIEKHFKAAKAAYQKWLQSKIEIVGEHSFEDMQVVVEGVDYNLMEFRPKLKPKEAKSVAIPINPKQ